MADLVNILHDYLAQRHFDLMPADVKSRFDKIIETSAFTGHMKTWYEKYDDNPLVMLDTAITGPTAADDWKAIYYACQKTFQDMDANKTNPVGYGSPYNNPTKDFIKKWFGNEYGKVFTISTPTTEASRVFNDLRTWLTANRNIVQTLLVRDFKDYIFTADYTYDRLLADLAAKRYEKDPEWRKKIESLLQHIYHYQQFPDPDHIPDLTAAGGTVLNFGTLNVSEPDTWYEIKDEAQHIDWFKAEYVNIFDKLLTNATIRSKFLEKAPPLIRDALSSAIADTDYENKESDDYLLPDPVDNKNFLQKIEKWKKDTYENHFRRFFDHNRGARIFYSPYSQNIMKGLDKAGVKPTDGIDGMLAKKDDPKLRGVVNADKQTSKHFDWFVKTMGNIKEQIPDAYEGALRNGHQLRQVVSYIITAAMKDGEVAKAKTAMEILSVAKYGLTCSRTFDRLKEATKDMKIFSDEKLSWNKNEGIQFVTKAFDATMGLALRGVGLAATSLHNFIQHRRTKFGNDIRKNKHLDSEYKKWQNKDDAKRTLQHNSNVAYDVAGKLAALDNPARAIAAPYKTQIQINQGTIEAIKTAIQTERDAGHADTDPLPGYAPATIGDAQNDVDIYEGVYKRSQLENDDKTWRKDNPDTAHDLIAYWDMLETYSKSHSFMLGSMKVKRDNFLKNWNDKKSKAQLAADAYIENYGRIAA